ncbi:hypothetical protein AAVH_22995 [Aphelenchoides avenae]|nr:hypothetical protein AAVH_22995 [Aphelenchus avenae]
MNGESSVEEDSTALESSSMETPATVDEDNGSPATPSASMKANGSAAEEKGFKGSPFNPPTPVSTTSSDGDETTMRSERERHNSSGVSSPRAPKRSASSLDMPMGARQLPKFTSNLFYTVQHAPAPRVLTGPVNTEFATPTHQARKQSRPNSPSAAGVRPIPPRGRIASIRRESDCSLESEVAHERLVKTAQQVSVGFEEFCLDDKVSEERKRAKSLTEPISIFTNAFLPQAPPRLRRVVWTAKRSMSPIAVRQISKRRYTGSNGSGLDSDGEGASSSNTVPTAVAAKRQCLTPRSAASPLVRDAFVQNYFHPESSPGAYPRCSSPLSVSSSTSSLTNFSMQRPRFLLDPSLVAQRYVALMNSFLHSVFSFGISCPTLDSDDNVMADDDRCSISVNDNSSTTFSSRAGTPVDEPSNEDPDSVAAPSNPNASSCSSSSSLPNLESLASTERNSPAANGSRDSPATSSPGRPPGVRFIGPVLPAKSDSVEEDDSMDADESAS